MKINPNMQGKLPRVAPAEPWSGKEGQRRGWKLTIPGGRPLATPAVANGRLFVGGGFGSYDFYSLDVATGAVVWQYQTEDDGPTAAVVLDDQVAFNTESCELEVLTTDGQRVWKQWLGDPLMSMPALDATSVYQVYPDSRGDHQHYLAAFDRATGRQHWKQRLPGEIITAPVLSEDCVYVTNLDGTISCFRRRDGERLWQEKKNATSSPVVRDGHCYFSQRREVAAMPGSEGNMQQMEELARRGKGAYGATQAYDGTASPADYLDLAKRQKRSPHYAASEMADGGVGFAFHKGHAKMEQAHKNLGHAHVSSLWAYQGSKPFLYRGRLFSALGETLHCVDPESQEVFWKKRLCGQDPVKEVLDNALTPPVLVNGKIFLGTIHGEIMCLTAESGDVLWREELGAPILFQPAVVDGRVFAATHQGTLFCLETGDERDDGWYMWGGDAAHNGLIV
jgi:outer membrane protein assembly factor BamB